MLVICLSIIKYYKGLGNLELPIKYKLHILFDLKFNFKKSRTN